MSIHAILSCTIQNMTEHSVPLEYTDITVLMSWVPVGDILRQIEDVLRHFDQISNFIN